MKTEELNQRSSGQACSLVVDVDGALLATNLLHEAILGFAAARPLRLWRLFAWAMSGRRLRDEPTLSALLADAAVTAPLCDRTLIAIKSAQEKGQSVYLASSWGTRVAEVLARRVGPVDGVFPSDADTADTGAPLSTAIRNRTFHFFGSTDFDPTVWRAAQKRTLTTRRGHTEADAYPGAEIVHIPGQLELGQYIRALRPHQWAKNLLVWLALLAGHHFSADKLAACAIAFVCFCLTASSAYLINDLLDLPNDRVHPQKRKRPFAAGRLPLIHGVWLAGALLAAAFLLSSALPAHFRLILALYAITTLAYSFYLKRRMMVDVVALSWLYTLRVFGGLVAIEVPQSPWLVMFSLLVFVSLAIVKRCSELIASGTTNHQLAGRGYRHDDLRVLMPLGVASAVSAVLVVALYFASPQVQALYKHPDRLWWVFPIIIYWIGRVFLLCGRGELPDDPVVFALTDKISLGAAFIVGAILLFATA